MTDRCTPDIPDIPDITTIPDIPDKLPVGVGGCSILCLTVLARLRKLSTMVLIFSLNTCSFSGPKIVEASLTMELKERLSQFGDSVSPLSYRLDTDLRERTELLAGVTDRGTGRSCGLILDSKAGTLMAVTGGNPASCQALLDSVSEVCSVMERSSSVSSRLIVLSNSSSSSLWAGDIWT